MEKITRASVISRAAVADSPRTGKRFDSLLKDAPFKRVHAVDIWSAPRTLMDNCFSTFKLQKNRVDTAATDYFCGDSTGFNPDHSEFQRSSEFLIRWPLRALFTMIRL